MKYIFIILQYLSPQHALSRAIGYLAQSETTWLKQLLIRRFIKTFQVNMEEAEASSPEAYVCFNDFFCRALKADARPICSATTSITSPADGVFSQLGKIDVGRILQAKGRVFSVEELLGTDRYNNVFDQGEFGTIYLSPKDYHRLHMPINGRLKSMTHIPGKLFSVNPTTTDTVPRLFARNERVVCMFDTTIGPVAMVLVGAMIVASIETVWAGLVTPPGKIPVTTDYQTTMDLTLGKGDEFARFKLGSTIIMLFGQGLINWENNLTAGSTVRMGECIAKIES